MKKHATMEMRLQMLNALQRHYLEHGYFEKGYAGNVFNIFHCAATAKKIWIKYATLNRPLTIEDAKRYTLEVREYTRNMDKIRQEKQREEFVFEDQQELEPVEQASTEPNLNDLLEKLYDLFLRMAEALEKISSSTAGMYDHQQLR